jgi:hypothetical protein
MSGYRVGVLGGTVLAIEDFNAKLLRCVPGHTEYQKHTNESNEHDFRSATRNTFVIGRYFRLKITGCKYYDRCSFPGIAPSNEPQTQRHTTRIPHPHGAGAAATVGEGEERSYEPVMVFF